MGETGNHDCQAERRKAARAVAGSRCVRGAAVGVTLLLALYGCDPSPEPGETAGGVPAEADAVGSGNATPGPTIRDTANAATHINVTLTEWFIGLDAQTADAGLISFSVVNAGQYPHALQVESDHWQTEHLMPGGSSVLELQLVPGTYYLSCPVYDEHGAHQEMGMRATLIVH
jgi:hypothetical protein